MALIEIRAFFQATPTLATSGQPTREQFAEIAVAGYEVVINLAVPSSTGAIVDEADVVSGHGMEYIPIPVVWEKPTREDLLRFFEVMEAKQEFKIYLHCAANMRVSAFLFLYRVLRLGMSEKEAERDLHRIWRPEGWWEAFIEDNLELGIG